MISYYSEGTSSESITAGIDNSKKEKGIKQKCNAPGHCMDGLVLISKLRAPAYDNQSHTESPGNRY